MGWATPPVTAVNRNPAGQPILFFFFSTQPRQLSALTVYVAAITQLKHFLYVFTIWASRPNGKHSTVWKLGKRFSVSPTPPPPPRSEGPATAYTFDPFGDLVLNVQGGPYSHSSGRPAWRALRAIVGPSGEKPCVIGCGRGGDKSGLRGRGGGGEGIGGLLFAEVQDGWWDGLDAHEGKVCGFL